MWSCRFGHWYYGHGKDRYHHLPEFRQIEDVHNEVHVLGSQIVHPSGTVTWRLRASNAPA